MTTPLAEHPTSSSLAARTLESIEIAGASKTYPIAGAPPLRALIETDLDVRAGEFVSLVGPSGCGKTTLLKMIAGLEAITQGSIRVGERQVTRPVPSVGLVFQRPALLKWYTVWENILLPAKVNKSLNRAVTERAAELLDFVGLGQFRDRYPAELSGGMQQRVSIVRALAAEPSVLLMDEPFSALDEFTRESLHDELLRLWQLTPKTVVFVTHNISEAVYLSDRVAVMAPRPGRIQQVVDITLPRARDAAVRSTPAFFEHINTIRAEFTQSGALGGDA